LIGNPDELVLSRAADIPDADFANWLFGWG
jgi:hypothetical protein